MLDRVAADLGVEVIVTPVGFKHLGAVMMERDVILAGEESGGMSILGHVPEKDGVLAGLLAAEMICSSGEGLRGQLDRLHSEYGSLCNRRIDLALDDESRGRVEEIFFSDRDPSEVGGRKVVAVARDGGVMLRLGGDTHVIVRLSGTEPLARVYVQAPDGSEVDELIGGIREQTGLEAI
jgi:phosphomannomutase